MAHETTTEQLWRRMDPITGGRVSADMALFLGRQTTSHQEKLMEAWDFIDHPSHATPAFRNAHRAPVGTAIVTSYQEQDYIEHSLGLYKGQLDSRLPFRALSYLNWPAGTSRRQIRPIRKLLNGFIKDNPDVPFAYFEGQEQKPIAIGRIRKLGTEVLLPFIDPTGLVTGHDSDHRDMSPGHFGELVAARQHSHYPVSGVIPSVVYERVPELPNIDHIIQWIEDAEVQEIAAAYAEPGPAFGADDYVRSSGYDEERNISETHYLISDIFDSLNRQIPIIKRVPSAVLTLSPRRLVEKLSRYERIGEIWTPENFIATDDYRIVANTRPDKITDLPNRLYDLRLREQGQIILGWLESKFASPPFPQISIGTRRTRALERLEDVRQRLGGPEDMFKRP